MADVYTPLTVTSINNLIGTPTLVGDVDALSDGLASTYVDLNLGETVQLLYSDVPDSGDVQLVLRAESIATTGTGLPTFNIQFILDSIGTTVRGQFGEQEGYELGTGDRYYVFALTPEWYDSLADASGDVWGKLSGSPPTWGEFWALFRAEGRLQVQATRSSVGLTSLTTRVYEARLGVGHDLAVTCQTETFEQGSVDGDTPEPVATDNTTLTDVVGAWHFTANGHDGQGARGTVRPFASPVPRLLLGSTTPATTVEASVDWKPILPSAPPIDGYAPLELWNLADDTMLAWLEVYGAPLKLRVTDGTVEHDWTIVGEPEQWWHLTAVLDAGAISFFVYREDGALAWAPPPLSYLGGLSAVGTSFNTNETTGGGTNVDNMRICISPTTPVIRQYPSTAASAWGGGPRQYPAPSRRPFGGFQ